MKGTYFSYVFILIVVLFLNACTNDTQNEEIHIASTENVDTVYVDYRSTNVTIKSTNETDITTRLLLYDNGPGVDMMQQDGRITFRVKSHIVRLFKIGRQPQLEIDIPTSYEGELILDGSSGNIVGENLQTGDLQVSGSSGDVQLDIVKLQNNIAVTLTSGNINMSLHDQKPNTSIHLNSNSGRRSINFLLDNHEVNKKTTKGILGNGEHDIILETSSGNIMLD